MVARAPVWLASSVGIVYDSNDDEREAMKSGSSNEEYGRGAASQTDSGHRGNGSAHDGAFNSNNAGSRVTPMSHVCPSLPRHRGTTETRTGRHGRHTLPKHVGVAATAVVSNN